MLDAVLTEYMWFIVSMIIRHMHIRTEWISLNKPDCTPNLEYDVSVWSLLLFLILFYSSS